MVLFPHRCAPEAIEAAKLGTSSCCGSGICHLHKRLEELFAAPLCAAAIFSILLAVAPLDTTDLVMGLFGAASVLAVLSRKRRVKAAKSKRTLRACFGEKSAPCDEHSQRIVPQAASRDCRGELALPKPGAVPPARTLLHCLRQEAKATALANGQTHRRTNAVLVEALENNQALAAPCPPMALVSDCLDAEVQEVLSDIAMTAESEAVVQQVVRAVAKVIKDIIPGAAVTGYASGDPTKDRTFGVAVPEVDLVVTASMDALLHALRERLMKGRREMTQLDERKVNKCAIRACIKDLVSVGGFKFRRSAFRNDEPKVTLIAPADMFSGGKPVPFDFWFNAVAPLRSQALLGSCHRLEPRASELVSLVRRWARDRGVSNPTKGHLSAYAWSLLAMYFMQFDTSDRGPLLPAFEAFTECMGLMEMSPYTNSRFQFPLGCRISTARRTSDLFADFVRFYSAFDWCGQAVSLHGCPHAQRDFQPLHNDTHSRGRRFDAGPRIKDPFDVTIDLGKSVTPDGMARMQEELTRATRLLLRGASLAELLEPWSPLVCDAPTGSKDSHEDDDVEDKGDDDALAVP
mmetsp:Transcript_88054/g.247519  ORF Transcript_88054/g.247519 Transcript_88054/m.247519 type:complete len:575 (+) Transcript_88054:98-1822(+)